MIIYISGKITGDPEYKSKFRKAEGRLKAMGHKVYNPCCVPDIFEWAQFLEIDKTVLRFCDAIFLLDDWKESKGAKVEYKEAQKLGLKIYSKEALPPSVILEEKPKETERTKQLKKYICELQQYAPGFPIDENKNILPEVILQDVARDIKKRRLSDYSVKAIKKAYGVTAADAGRVKLYLTNKKEITNVI